jgi:HAD superfamily hydrolase (TIGR01458 family)
MRVRAVLCDIDGVLTVSWRAIPGAPEALRRIRGAGLPVAFLTNTTSRTRDAIAAAMVQAGFDADPEEIFTAAAIGAAYLRRNHPGARVHLLNSGDVRADLAGVDLADAGERPDVVVLGGAGPEFSYQALSRVFGYLVDGVPLVAMHRNLVWRTAAGLQPDTGAFLEGLERAAGVSATVVGKPAPEFFAAALDALGADPAEAVMVGDDVEHDVLAAQREGITGVLVRTGKFRPADVEHASGAPDHVIDSFVDLPRLLFGAERAGTG